MLLSLLLLLMHAIAGHSATNVIGILNNMQRHTRTSDDNVGMISVMLGCTLGYTNGLSPGQQNIRICGMTSTTNYFQPWQLTGGSWNTDLPQAYCSLVAVHATPGTMEKRYTGITPAMPVDDVRLVDAVPMQVSLLQPPWPPYHHLIRLPLRRRWQQQPQQPPVTEGQ